MKDFTIITDPGVDDILALVLLKKLMPKNQNTLVSSFGNVSEKLTSINVKEFINFFASDWQYSHGAKKPLKPLKFLWSDYFHGPDGVCKVHPLIINKQKINYVKLFNIQNLISLAPMTSVYKIMKQNQFNNVVIMGGAFNIKGNETEFAETNMAFDPDAAAYFFNNCSSINTKVIPLDVTKKVFWSKEKILSIPENADYKIWLKYMLIEWFNKYGGQLNKNFDLHDPLAIYSIFYPINLVWKKSGLKVISTGVKKGQTILDNNNPECQVAIDVNNANKIANLIFELIFN